ncbi:MAG: hypothetical protein ACO1SV_26500 [Fimbriimonas sp.]
MVDDPELILTQPTSDPDDAEQTERLEDLDSPDEVHQSAEGEETDPE